MRPIATSTLLSQALVAFTIEVDNAFELAVPHRTTEHGPPPGNSGAPWLVSRVMWQMLLRHVPPDGISIAELKQRSGLAEKSFRIWLTRLSDWWGYLAITRDPSVLGGQWVRATSGGAIAIAAWPTIDHDVERRWGTRFGTATLDRLSDALGAIDAQLDTTLPDYLPILGYGLSTSAALNDSMHGTPVRSVDHGASLPRLLNRVLLAFALEFEQNTSLPLALTANVLRILGQDGVRVRDIPAMTGVSKEGVEISLKLLRKGRGAALAADPDGKRVRAVRITERGAIGQERHHQGVAQVEKDWSARYGSRRITSLRSALAQLTGDGTALDPQAAGWRAKAKPRTTLPHFPMILHRGGFPDGS